MAEANGSRVVTGYIGGRLGAWRLWWSHATYDPHVRHMHAPQHCRHFYWLPFNVP